MDSISSIKAGWLESSISSILGCWWIPYSRTDEEGLEMIREHDYKVKQMGYADARADAGGDGDGTRILLRVKW